MGVHDDFGLWERELGEGLPEESEGRGMAVCAGLTGVGCTAMIVLGQVPLGVAGLVVAGLILVLWRAGM